GARGGSRPPARILGLATAARVSRCAQRPEGTDLMTMLIDKRALSSALCLGAAALSSPALAAQASPAAPPLMLADTYDNAAVDVSHYWVSEKYDGVRAYWNGRQLLTRTGQLI